MDKIILLVSDKKAHYTNLGVPHAVCMLSKLFKRNLYQDGLLQRHYLPGPKAAISTPAETSFCLDA